MLTTEDFRIAAEQHPYEELTLRHDAASDRFTIESPGSFHGRTIRTAPQDANTTNMMHALADAVREEYPDIADLVLSSVDTEHLKQVGFRSDTILQVFSNIAQYAPVNAEEKSEILTKSDQTLGKLQELSSPSTRAPVLMDAPGARMMLRQKTAAPSSPLKMAAAKEHAATIKKYASDAAEAAVAEAADHDNRGAAKWIAHVTWNVDELKTSAENAARHVASASSARKSPSPPLMESVAWTPQERADQERAIVLLKVAEAQVTAAVQQARDVIVKLESPENNIDELKTRAAKILEISKSLDDHYKVATKFINPSQRERRASEVTTAAKDSNALQRGSLASLQIIQGFAAVVKEAKTAEKASTTAAIEVGAALEAMKKTFSSDFPELIKNTRVVLQRAESAVQSAKETSLRLQSVIANTLPMERRKIEELSKKLEATVEVV